MVVCLRNRMWRRSLIVVAIGAMAALSLAPYLSVVRAGRDVFVTAQRALTVSDVLSAGASAFGSGEAHLFSAWLLGGAGALVAGAALVARVRRDVAGAGRVDRAIFSLTVLVVGTLAFLIFLKATRLPTRPWYCIGLMGCMALSIDSLVDSVATTARRRVGRLVVTLAIAAVTIPFTWTAVQLRQTNVDVIASVLQRAASPEDLIVLSPWYCAVTFERYYRGRAPWTPAPPIKQLGLHHYDLLKEAMATADPQRPVFDRIATTLGAGHRVWVVGTLPLLAPGQRPPNLAPAPH